MRQLLINTLIMVVAMFIAAWILTPGTSSSGRSVDFSALTGKGKEASANAGGGEEDGDTGDTGDVTVIRRDASGQFHLVAQINGEDTSFLVDTGADTMALTVDDAERLNLNFNPGDFVPITKTASGTGYGAPVRIETLRLGSTEFHNISGVVIDGLEVNLLGQSVLQRLGKVEIEGDRMVIHHR